MEVGLGEQYRPMAGSPNYYGSSPSYSSINSYPMTPTTPGYTPSKSQSLVGHSPNQAMPPGSPHLSSSVQSIHSSQRGGSDHLTAPSAAYPTYQNATPVQSHTHGGTSVREGGSQRGGSMRDLSLVSSGRGLDASQGLRSSLSGAHEFAPFPSNLVNGSSSKSHHDPAKSLNSGDIATTVPASISPTHPSSQPTHPSSHQGHPDTLRQSYSARDNDTKSPPPYPPSAPSSGGGVWRACARRG